MKSCILQIIQQRHENLVKLISNNFNLIKPKKYEKNIFTIFSQRELTIEAADTETIDTELTIELPENCTAFLATKFEGQDIQKLLVLVKKGLGLLYEISHIQKNIKLTKETLLDIS